MGGALMGMRPGDLLVQYRDKNLALRGSIPLPDLSLKVQPVLNGVGSWSVTLPAEHRAVPYLRAPGAGVVITNMSTNEVVMSGSASKPTKKATTSDPKGMVTIGGLSDDRLLWDAMSYPEPTNADITTQALSHDVFSGDAETVMRHFVDANIGQSAPAGRKTGSLREFIRLQAVNNHLGANVDKSIRFDYIGDVLHEIATLRGLRFRLVQVGSIIELQISEIVDRTAFIRLDIENGTLQEQSVEFAPPKVTRMIVAGQGEGIERQLLMRTTAESLEGEADWGLIIEQFKDQRNTAIVEELEQAGDEVLAADGFTKVAVKATPTNDQTMIFQEDFDLGDKVTVVIDGQETTSNITEAAIVCDASGLTSAVAIGDVRDFDSASALRQTVTDNTRRIGDLERNIEVGGEVAWDDIAGKPTFYQHPVGSVQMTAAAAAPSGWLLCEGQSLLRADYPALFTAIGTTYGSVDGTHFTLPNIKGKVPVGLDSADTQFDVLGETGGEKAHTLTIPEMPMHQHQQVFSTHAIASGGGSTLGGMTNSGGNQAGAAQQHTNYSGGDGTTDPGESLPHNNLQPYIVLNYIIKT